MGMGIQQCEDAEAGGKTGLEDLRRPLVEGEEKIDVVSNGGCGGFDDLSDGSSTSSGEDGSDDDGSGGSIWMVLLSTSVAVCGSFQFGSCVGYSAPTQSAIREDLDLSLAEYSMFGSIVTIGAMLAAITSGLITDFFGRKGAMRMAAIICITGWLAIYFSMGALLLDIGRFNTGYGIGIFSYVVPIFIAEISPKSIRGGLTTLNQVEKYNPMSDARWPDSGPGQNPNLYPTCLILRQLVGYKFRYSSQLMIVTGSSVAFLLGTVITWRTLALTGLVPCVILLIGLVFIPESPRWLAKVGRDKEFEASLRQLRGKNTDISKEATEIQLYIESLRSLPREKMTDLFQSKYIRSVIIGVGLMVFQQFGGINGIGFYVSETFVAAGLSSGRTGTIAYACIQVPITIVGAILMDKSGRRPLIMVSASGTFLGCFLTGASFFLKSHGMLLDWVPILAVGGVLIFIAFFSIGMGAVPWVIMSEIFPLNVKGVGGSLVVLVNWLGAWAVSFTFNFLMSWSPTGTFSMYAGFSALTILFVAKVVPETKGKTLEEIQASINS